MCIENNRPTVALFATCLLNNFRPSIGFAAVKLLEAAGYRVIVPKNQSCCGQPNYNNGDPDGARNAAQTFFKTFAGIDRIVVPSASCGGMIKNHFPRLMAGTVWEEQAQSLANNTWELADFLYQQSINPLPKNESFTEAIAHHDSCSSLREMKVTHQVRKLIQHSLPNAKLVELTEPEACCGFGGTFCVKFNGISQKLGNNKLKDIAHTQATVVSSLDLGCNLHLQSLAPHQSTNLNIVHFAELLANAVCSQMPEV